MRRRLFGIAIVAVFAVLTIVAWLSKPEPLRVSIEKAGINLSGSETEPGLYRISQSDQKKLQNLVTSMGYSYEHLSGPNVEVHRYAKEIRVLWLWHHTQSISFSRAAPDSVHINPALR